LHQHIHYYSQEHTVHQAIQESSIWHGIQNYRILLGESTVCCNKYPASSSSSIALGKNRFRRTDNIGQCKLENSTFGRVNRWKLCALIWILGERLVLESFMGDKCPFWCSCHRFSQRTRIKAENIHSKMEEFEQICKFNITTRTHDSHGSLLASCWRALR
jgi:hypothetical protein